MANEVGWDWPDLKGYKPLGENGTNIRLLTILPGDGPLHCTLSHANLSESRGRYSALSYVWGKAGEMIAITVNEEQVMLRRTVWAFLRHLRENAHGDPFNVWLDVLCINQRDLKEKSSQVSMMTTIFDRADHVHGWLGETYPLVDQAFEFLKQVKLFAEPNGRASLLTKEDIDSFRAHHANELPRYAAGVRALFSNEYWKRVWVMQELMFGLCKEITVHCGPLNHPGADIVFGLTQISRSLGRSTSFIQELFPDDFGTGDSLSNSIHTRFNIFSRGMMSPLVEALLLTRDCDCSDPRDTIYGVLPFCMFDRELVKVDYTASTLDLFEAVLPVIATPRDDLSSMYSIGELWHRMKLGNLQQNLKIVNPSRLSKILNFTFEARFTGFLSVPEDGQNQANTLQQPDIRYCFAINNDKDMSIRIVFQYDKVQQKFVHEALCYDFGSTGSSSESSANAATALRKVDAPAAVRFELEHATDEESVFLRSQGLIILEGKVLGLKPSLAALNLLVGLIMPNGIERSGAIQFPNERM